MRIAITKANTLNPIANFATVFAPLLIVAWPFLLRNPYLDKFTRSDYASHLEQITNNWNLPLYYWGDWFLRCIWWPIHTIVPVGSFFATVCLLAVFLACYCIYKFGQLSKAGLWIVPFVLFGCYGILEYLQDAIIIDFIATYIIGMGYLYFMYRWVTGGSWKTLALSFTLLLFACLFHYKSGGELFIGSSLFLVLLLVFKQYRLRALSSIMAAILATGIAIVLYSTLPMDASTEGIVKLDIGSIGHTTSSGMLSPPLGAKTFLGWQFNPFSALACALSFGILVWLRKKLAFAQLLPLGLVACFVVVLAVGGFTSITRHPDRFGLDLSIFLMIGLAMMYRIVSDLLGHDKEWLLRYQAAVVGMLCISALITIPRYEFFQGSI